MEKIRYTRYFAGLMVLISIIEVSCKTSSTGGSQKTLFTLVDTRQTHIQFVNQVEYTEEYNTYTYRNFYNGAGVGIGDFNNDGLPDIYFCGNLVENKLYLNKGGFVFEDITEKAGVACKDVWSTGVSIADVNGDGWQDIYVCKSGNPKGNHRYNELFINNGDLTFTESAAVYGIADMGLSNHASFFDYDLDGDLDCYLLNNSFQSVTEFDIRPDQRQIRDTLGGNKLYRNDDGHFTDVSKEAGIYGSKIGFGLGVSVGDLNRDGWPDIYVSNDFFERDYLYINSGDGTFRESLEEAMREISLGAMGADVADINNDAFPEIFATEMTPEGNARLKTKVLFENWERYQMKINNGYYRQFSRNVLQLNNRNGSFSEIGRFSGVSTTDWSWGALIMDLDNDGWKDIFVANGIFKDLLDRDFLDIYSNPAIMRSMIKTEEQAILKMIDMIPSVKVPNYAFHNNGDLTFTNQASPWGLGSPSFSNGAAYGDLDNDGDLDMVVSNVNMPPFVYRNESRVNGSTNYLTIKLNGDQKNTAAIGASVTVYYNGRLCFQELFPMRGFQSSMDSRLHFGLGSAAFADSLIVIWPGGKQTRLQHVQTNQLIELHQKDSTPAPLHDETPVTAKTFSALKAPAGLDFIVRENDFVDFAREKLLFRMMSNEGPHLAVGDVNGDRCEDIYVCGAKDFAGSLLIQEAQGKFRKTNIELFEADKISEDTDCEFFDSDGDGDLDLYVTSGGNEFPSSSSALRDRLYINDGRGRFTRSPQRLPVARYESSSCVNAADYDLDGDMDLFVGIRLKPFNYGLPVNGYLLENDGKGNFSDVSAQKITALKEIGMITGMAWADIENDGDPDMVITGDWMPLKVFINEQGHFRDASENYGLSGTEGWWHTVIAKDLNNDGSIDFVVGNEGLNSFFKASLSRPVTMYVNDFDLNGTVEQIICAFNGDRSYPVVMKDDLVKQIPSLAKKYVRYDDYKDQTITDIFPEEVMKRSVQLKANMMESCILMNRGVSFEIIPLPAEAQFSPVYAIFAEDFDHDGNCDLLLGGNQYRAKPETGINDAGYGLLLKGNGGKTWQPLPALESGIFAKGEIRDIQSITIGSNRIMVIARNNETLQFYTY